MSGKAALQQSRLAIHADQLFCNVRQEATVMGASPSSWGCQWSWTQHSNTSTPTCRLAAQLLPPCSVQQASVLQPWSADQGCSLLQTMHTAAATASSLCTLTCSMHAWFVHVHDGAGVLWMRLAPWSSEYTPASSLRGRHDITSFLLSDLRVKAHSRNTKQGCWGEVAPPLHHRIWHVMTCM